MNRSLVQIAYGQNDSPGNNYAKESLCELLMKTEKESSFLGQPEGWYKLLWLVAEALLGAMNS